MSAKKPFGRGAATANRFDERGDVTRECPGLRLSLATVGEVFATAVLPNVGAAVQKNSVALAQFGAFAYVFLL